MPFLDAEMQLILDALRLGIAIFLELSFFVVAGTNSQNY